MANCEFCNGSNDVRRLETFDICADCVVTTDENTQPDGTILVTLFSGWDKIEADDSENSDLANISDSDLDFFLLD